jgi:hypothetical protein
MTRVSNSVREFVDRQDACRRRHDDIWHTFARDGETEAQVLRGIAELAFSLSEAQVLQMELDRGQGLAVWALMLEQKALLSKVEPMMRELGILDPEQELTTWETTLAFHSSGQMWFGWDELPDRVVAALRWLPYALCDTERMESFSEAQRQWRDRKDWLVEQLANECWQAMLCSRFLFELGSSLTQAQIARMVAQDALPVTALSPGQRVLVDAAARAHPKRPAGDPGCLFVRFDLQGQFWCIHRGRTRVSRWGAGWLPYSWTWDNPEHADSKSYRDADERGYPIPSQFRRDPLHGTPATSRVT